LIEKFKTITVNKYTFITNKMSYLVWLSMFYQKNFMVITN